MRLVLGTYNVRGLCSRLSRTKLKNLIRSVKPSLDIVAIQEHKLREQNINFITSSLWPHAAIFNLPAIDGVHAERNPLVTGGKGGVLLAVNQSLVPLIVSNGLLPFNGGLWIHMDTPDGSKLGVAAIYAPHTSAERTHLWAALEATLDISRKWIFLGDFNMTTNPSDQTGGNRNIISGEELSRWTALVQALELHDTFRKIDGELQFSWDNRRAANLTDTTQEQLQFTDTGRILKQLSDHSPVIATIQLGPPPSSKKCNYRLNTAALNSVKLKEHLAFLWRKWQLKYELAGTPPLQTLRACIKRAANFCQLWGKKEAATRKEKQDKLILKVKGLKLQLQADPANVSSQFKLKEAQHQLQSWEAEKARWLQKHLDRKWEQQGDRCSKLFFSTVRARKAQTAIHALKDENGTLHTDEKKIMDLTASYFAQILQEPPENTSQLQATETLLAQTTTCVSAQERDTLQADFSAQELLVAAKLLGRNKCPGPDGIPLEFFLCLWDTICPLLLQATTQGFQQGILLPFFNKGTITLLHKDGDAALLKNKRPITLLNAVYKIWAKALQMRLAPVLQRLITWEQNAFLAGRQLHTTVFLCNEAVFQAKIQKQDSVLLKIDYRKGFDTIRWDFLYAAMHKMQFGDTFITFVQTLNNAASSSVRINNATSKSFAISRSVRQGCPLSPLLFTIAVQVLTDVINQMALHDQIRGINLHSIGLQYYQGYFADDSHLLLRADRQNLLNAQNTLHMYGQASGLIVQWEKSKARWISAENPRPPWTSELDWVWGMEDDSDKLLGFHFKDGLDEETIYQVALQKIQKWINSPTARSTTIHGRIVIANHLIYGILWFLLPLWAGGKSKIRHIERLVLIYVWGGNEDSKRRHRVAENILHQKKTHGGLGLMSLHAQMQAFAVKTIRWALTPGTHPLKAWLLASFDSISATRWGSTHLTWLSSPSKGKWPPLSPILLHICQLWQTSAKLLQPLQQLPLQLWTRLSIWGPKVTGVWNISRSAITGSNARLKNAGICVIADITSDGRSIIPLQQAAGHELQITDNISRAYLKITATTPHHAVAFRSASGFATSPSTDPMWVIKLKDETPNDDSQIGRSHATAAFIVSQDGLQQTDLSNVPIEASWNRAPVATFWNSQKRPRLRMLYTWQDNNAIIAGLQWNDQSNFLASSKADIRRLLTTDASLANKRLHKWVLSHHLDPEDTTRWTKLWSTHRPIKLSLFQWFILFQALPTNTWRFPKASRTDDVTWCTCCTSRAAEDIEHMLWKCSSVQSLWTWALDVLYTAFQRLDDGPLDSLTRCLVRKSLNIARRPPDGGKPGD
ncbi:hypothetical protein R1sor_020313 [Riccia sorocarpa]|uniref:Reverse transcriptase domain-containing protein n=1 Tax=Riccia sorocarpa TaxID=122646 RepID=A0ABD3IFQ5_9MARC